MATPHIGCEKQDIAPVVLMPGDPLRAKYIAENFLEDYKLVNTVRGMTAYTGYYKNKRITIFPAGMGMASMSIYAYELYKFYNVKNIIRIGSCGAYKPELKLFDIILSENVFSESNFALTLNNEENFAIYSAVFPGALFAYSRKVIRLASDAISVPTPPTFTPTSRSL